MSEAKDFAIDLARPFGLPDGSSFGKEFSKHGLDVQDGRAIQGIQTLHRQRQVLNGEQSADGCGNSVGSPLRPLSKNADFGPLHIASGMPASGDDRAFIYAVQVKQNLDMGELREAVQRLGRKGVAIQDNFRNDLAPVVFPLAFLAGAHATDRR